MQIFDYQLISGDSLNQAISKVTLRIQIEDIDKTSDRRNGMVRLNMLKRYMVKNGSDMTLVSQESQNADDSNKIHGGYCCFLSCQHI
jgi:hypothetical protein